MCKQMTDVELLEIELYDHLCVNKWLSIWIVSDTIQYLQPFKRVKTNK